MDNIPDSLKHKLLVNIRLFLKKNPTATLRDVFIEGYLMGFQEGISQQSQICENLEERVKTLDSQLYTAVTFITTKK